MGFEPAIECERNEMNDIRTVWFKTGLRGLSLIQDQTLVLNFGLSGKFGLF